MLSMCAVSMFSDVRLPLESPGEEKRYTVSVIVAMEVGGGWAGFRSLEVEG